MDNKKKIFDELDLMAGKMRYEGLSQLLFLAALGSGILFNGAVNIVDDLMKGFGGNYYYYYSLSVLILAAASLAFIWFCIDKFYMRPIKVLEKKIEELRKEENQD